VASVSSFSFSSIHVPFSRNESGCTYVAVNDAPIMCALPIQERDAAGMATETR
jgi:hypothetical protein